MSPKLRKALGITLLAFPFLLVLSFAAYIAPLNTLIALGVSTVLAGSITGGIILLTPRR